MDLIPNTPLSEEEIGELDVFLMSDATPDDCMDIVALDGFLTALVIGPKLVLPSVWRPLVWGGEEAPAFESSVQAERIIGLDMRRYNEICRMFDDNGTGFAPLLYAQEVGKETQWNGEDWCAGFMYAVDLSFGDWQPLFDDEHSGVLLAPIHTLGTEAGWKELDASADPETACEAALEALGPSIAAIADYWPNIVASKKADLRTPARRPGRNDACPCGSGRKFKKCCAAGSTI
jgi:uncharacterized protein